MCNEVVEQQCKTVNEKVCEQVVEEECSLQEEEVSSVSSTYLRAFQISSKPEVCDTVDVEKCSTVKEKECAPVKREQCQNIFEEVCNQVVIILFWGRVALAKKKYMGDLTSALLYSVWPLTCDILTRMKQRL